MHEGPGAGRSPQRRPTTPTRIGLLLLALALALALGGCSGDDPAKPPATGTATPTTPPSPTPSATPSALAPTAPKAELTRAGAEAFVRYFWAVFNYSQLNLDAEPLLAISGSDCLFCSSAVKGIAELTRDHQRIHGGVVTVTTALAPPGDLKLGPIVTAVITQTPGQTVSAEGVVTSTSAGVRNMRSEIALEWMANRWRVRDVANDEGTGTKW